MNTFPETASALLALIAASTSLSSIANAVVESIWANAAPIPNSMILLFFIASSFHIRQKAGWRGMYPPYSQTV